MNVWLGESVVVRLAGNTIRPGVVNGLHDATFKHVAVFTVPSQDGTQQCVSCLLLRYDPTGESADSFRRYEDLRDSDRDLVCGPVIESEAGSDEPAASSPTPPTPPAEGGAEPA